MHHYICVEHLSEVTTNWRDHWRRNNLWSREQTWIPFHAKRLYNQFLILPLLGNWARSSGMELSHLFQHFRQFSAKSNFRYKVDCLTNCAHKSAPIQDCCFIIEKIVVESLKKNSISESLNLWSNAISFKPFYLYNRLIVFISNRSNCFHWTKKRQPSVVSWGETLTEHTQCSGYKLLFLCHIQQKPYLPSPSPIALSQSRFPNFQGRRATIDVSVSPHPRSHDAAVTSRGIQQNRPWC